MKPIRQALTAGLVGAAACGAWAAPARITAAIDSTVLEMGSRAVITLNIADASHSGTLTGLPPELSEPADQEAFDFSSIETDTTPGGYTVRVGVQAWYPGVVVLPPFGYATGSDTAYSEPLTIKIMPVAMDSTQQLNPYEGPVAPPRKWYDHIPDWAVFALLGLVVAAALAAVALMYRNYRRHGSILVPKPKPIDPYAEAKAALEDLRRRRLAESGQEKEFYTHLIDILRLYLQRRFDINAMEMSSTQILESLRRNPETRDNQPRIKQILELADFVKFAKVRPMPDDNVKAFQAIEQFVESTKPAPAPETAAEAQKNKK